MKRSGLVLLPNLLDYQHPTVALLPQVVQEEVIHLDGIIAESEKMARHFLKLFTFPSPKTFREVPIRLLNEHSKKEEIKELLIPLSKGEMWGLISDAGLPCLADPGALLVRYAREAKIPIRAHMGPSAIIQTLMLSGLSGQSFAFLGYLPKEEGELKKAIQRLSQNARTHQTQIFIETPYRNDKLLGKLLELLPPDLSLSLGIDLTCATEEILFARVSNWKSRSLPALKDRPTVFVVGNTLE